VSTDSRWDTEIGVHEVDTKWRRFGPEGLMALAGLKALQAQGLGRAAARGAGARSFSFTLM